MHKIYQVSGPGFSFSSSSSYFSPSPTLPSYIPTGSLHMSHKHLRAVARQKLKRTVKERFPGEVTYELVSAISASCQPYLTDSNCATICTRQVLKEWRPLLQRTASMYVVGLRHLLNPPDFTSLACGVWEGGRRIWCCILRQRPCGTDFC